MTLFSAQHVRVQRAAIKASRREWPGWRRKSRLPGPRDDVKQGRQDAPFADVMQSHPPYWSLPQRWLQLYDMCTTWSACFKALRLNSLGRRLIHVVFWLI